jgi:predicted nucleic acid-binding protein
VVNEELSLIYAAFDLHQRYKYSYYDSLIIAAAVNSQCHTLASEDLQDGQIIEGRLSIVNPFVY